MSSLSAPAQCPFLNFPTVLFDIIVRLTYPEKWAGKMPAIIKALRPLPGLYQRALALFDKEHYAFVLHQGNQFGAGDMSAKAISYITKVVVAVNPELLKGGILFKKSKGKESNDCYDQLLQASHTLRLVPNVQIMIDPQGESPKHYEYRPNWLVFMAKFTPQTLKMSIPIVNLPPDVSEDDESIRILFWTYKKDVLQIFKAANWCLGEMGKPCRVYAGKSRVAAVDLEWIWVAKDGERLSCVSGGQFYDLADVDGPWDDREGEIDPDISPYDN